MSGRTQEGAPGPLDPDHAESNGDDSRRALTDPSKFTPENDLALARMLGIAFVIGIASLVGLVVLLF